MERLHELLDSVDPAMAELAELVRAVGDLDPTRGAQQRVRSAIARRKQLERACRRKVVVLLVVAITLTTVTAGVNKLIPSSAPASAARQDPPIRVLTPPDAGDERHDVPAASPQAPPAPPVPVLQLPQKPVAPRKRSPVAPARPTALSFPVQEVSQPSPLAEVAAQLASAPSLPPVPPVPPESPMQETMSSARSHADLVPERSDEATLVLGALRSLRRDHDVQSALRQVEAYRRRFPSGDLAEEALALSIEASAALEDRAALALADEYLRRFPKGRFRTEAERAQRRFQTCTRSSFIKGLCRWALDVVR